MDKLEKLKEAMKNPPPERLARIEYQSHFFQMIGISAVCIILLAKGYWYIIFAFIFGVGISYSQGMTAYNKYVTIISLLNPTTLEDIEKEISPTRKRNKVITTIIPHAKWLSILSSVIITVLLIDPTLSRWLLMLLYPLTLIVTFIFFHFFFLYWICYPFYKGLLKKEKSVK